MFKKIGNIIKLTVLAAVAAVVIYYGAKIVVIALAVAGVVAAVVRPLGWFSNAAVTAKDVVSGLVGDVFGLLFVVLGGAFFAPAVPVVAAIAVISLVINVIKTCTKRVSDAVKASNDDVTPPKSADVFDINTGNATNPEFFGRGTKPAHS